MYMCSSHLCRNAGTAQCVCTWHSREGILNHDSALPAALPPHCTVTEGANSGEPEGSASRTVLIQCLVMMIVHAC